MQPLHYILFSAINKQDDDNDTVTDFNSITSYSDMTHLLHILPVQNLLCTKNTLSFLQPTVLCTAHYHAITCYCYHLCQGGCFHWHLCLSVSSLALLGMCTQRFL